MYLVHDILLCTIPQNTSAESTMPAVQLEAGLAADRKGDRAGWSGRGFRRSFALSA